MDRFKIGDKVKILSPRIYRDEIITIEAFDICYGETYVKGHLTGGLHVCVDVKSIELVKCNIENTFKFNVGDKVIYKENVFVVKSQIHNPKNDKNYYILEGKPYPHREDNLELFESIKKASYVDDLKASFDTYINVKDIVSDKEINKEYYKNKGENFDMNNVKDIRTGSKIVTIPQTKAAPKKVECKTVIVTIGNKEYEAVCMPDDEFSLEKGIEVAILKAIFGGTKEYSKFIRNMVKFYHTCEKKRKEDDRVVAKREKDIARKLARKAKKAEAERQARVDEMAEAFFKGMQKYDISMDAMVDADNTRVMNIDMEKICSDFLASKGLVAVSVDNITDDTN